MSVKVIIGPANSGKSFSLCNEMVNRAVDEPGRRFIAIVPEQFTLQMQRRVVTLHPRHSVMNIDIVSFERLAHRVFAELGRDERNVLDDTGKALVLRKLLTDIKDDLTVYSGKVRMPGFVEEIKSIITEFKQYDIDDNQLYLMQTAAEERGNMLLSGKLQDLRLIYRKFNEEIEEKFTTAEEVLEIFARMVPSSELIKGTSIYLDGFTGFTPVQYRLIRELMKYAEDMTFAFSLPEEQLNPACLEHEMFYLSNQSINKISRIAEETGNEFLTIPLAASEKEKTKVCKFAASNTMDEAMFIASKIRELVGQGYRYRDIAVVTNDMEEYYPSFRDVFEEAGITCFIDYKTELSENPLARFVLAALELADSGFSYEGVFGYLKSGMTDLSSDEISKLENYCLEFGIKGYKKFAGEFTANRTRYGSEEQVWDLEEVNDIRSRMMKTLEPYYSNIKKSKYASNYCKALNALMEANNVEDRIASMQKEFDDKGQLSLAKEYDQVMGLVQELLEKTSMLLEGESVEIKEYIDIVKTGLAEIKVGIIPPGLDALAVGDLTRSRFDKIKVLFFAGFNEGTIPKVAGKNGLFTQKEREFLKGQDFELAPGVLENLYSQRFYLYLMLAKPSKELYLTYSASRLSGEQLEPSCVLEEIHDYMDCDVIEEIKDMPAVTWKLKAERDVAASVGSFINFRTSIQSDDQALLRIFAEDDKAAFEQILQGGFYTNKTTSLDSQVALDLYGDVLSGSVSRYENFSKCAFRHFISYGLGLEKRPEYEVGAADIGTLYHEAIENYSKTLNEEGFTFRNINDEDSHRIAKDSVKQAIDNMTYDAIESTARNEYLLDRVEEVTLRTTDVLREHVKAGLFEPSEYEWGFSSGIGEDIRFRGKIDRVDIYDGGDMYVKIIDYKSGSISFDIREIYTGRQLQLVAYMKEALADIKKKNPDRNVKPGGVYYYHIGDRYVAQKDLRNKYKMSGLTLSEPAAYEAMDIRLGNGETNKSNIVNVTLTSNGIHERNSTVADNGEFLNLMDFVEGKIVDISKDIKAGNIDINPFDDGQSSACVFCDFKDICKFEPDTFGVGYRDKEDLTNEEIKDIIYGRIAGEGEADA